ncbi:NAD dependent epimerase/dehydratase family protein [Plectosphaerella plurivora]|uniref:NAD dependent epimerase/dehydratase family protein n=1 Tax=Plectosphaerella plurivora TaxID=936078 RepID=A0A9P9AB79_9PEZI|nr:NAD dependent epimerase/dehydratase family protein [Plectosphaerella plurivora]
MAVEPQVLVTGAAGHLGCALMLSLLPDHNLTPIGIDILPSETTTHVGSITDRAFITSIFTRYPSIRHVIHAATLHKPHVESHSKTDFVEVNITGTLNLLEEASQLRNADGTPRIASFVFTSTTSSFGKAVRAQPGDPAAWIDEAVVPVPKNIYGVTKIAAEDLCRLVQSQTGMPTIVLRVSRFFPEEDDDEERRSAMGDENLKVLELAYRRADVADIVSACVCATQKAADIGWGRYIISGPPPFPKDDIEVLRRLDRDAASVFKLLVPGIEDVFATKGWSFLRRLDRVYDSSKAVEEIGWQPEYTIGKAIEKIARGEDWRSPLTYKVGKKGYHAVSTGVYTSR